MCLLRVLAGCLELGERFSLALPLCPIRNPSGKMLQRPPRACHRGPVLGPPQSYADAYRRVQVNETPLLQVAHRISQCKRNVDTARQQNRYRNHTAGALLVVVLQGCQGSLLEILQMLPGLVDVAAVHGAPLQPLDFSQEPLRGTKRTEGKMVR